MQIVQMLSRTLSKQADLKWLSRNYIFIF